MFLSHHSITPREKYPYATSLVHRASLSSSDNWCIIYALVLMCIQTGSGKTHAFTPIHRHARLIQPLSFLLLLMSLWIRTMMRYTSLPIVPGSALWLYMEMPTLTASSIWLSMGVTCSVPSCLSYWPYWAQLYEPHQCSLPGSRWGWSDAW